MDSLTQYKSSVQSRLDNADLLVSKLVHENTLLSQQVDNKQQEIDTLKQQLEALQTKHDSLAKKQGSIVEEIDIVRDLFEHLCGVRVHKSYEDEAGLWFDTSQGNRYGVMDYKLGFVKGEASETEVLYVPLLKQRSSQELQQLQKQLPSYMFDTLSFPLKSLNQFYNKLSKCLCKNSSD